MRPELVEYVRYRMARANQALRVAKRALEDGDLHETVSRLYYACFYLVSALLLTEGVSAAKHKGIWTLFDQRWINTGRLPKEMGRLYHRLFKNRQTADYSDLVVFSREEVESWFQEATVFMTTISKHIEEQLRERQKEG